MSDGHGVFGNGQLVTVPATASSAIGLKDYSVEVDVIVQPYTPTVQFPGIIGSATFNFCPIYLQQNTALCRSGLGGSGYTPLGSDVMSNAKRRHVAVTADRDGSLVLYIDGLISGSPVDISSKVSFNVTNIPLTIGKAVENVYVNFFMYHARLYSGLLSSDDVYRLYRDIHAYRAYYSNSLVFDYDMKPKGGVVPDLSGNGNHGVITGPYQYVSGGAQDDSWWW